MPDHDDLTQLLNAAAIGDANATEAVAPRIYDELRALARWNLSKLPSGATLQTTALVNEAWIRLLHDGSEPNWEGRRHFFFTAARAMRDILVSDARRKEASKRGGDRQQVELQDLHLIVESPVDDLLDLDRALRRLEEKDETGAQLVLLRFFGGLTMDEAAAMLEMPLRNAERKWRFVRSWLRRELERPHP